MPDRFDSTYQKNNKSRSTQLLQKTLQAIEKFQLVKPGATILAAVSGGPDSVCLLDLLVKLSPELNVSVGVAHLNHGLRAAEADRDADFVRSLAGSYDLPFYHEKKDVRTAAKNKGLSLEEAGRMERYAFFNNIAKSRGYNRIALAHNSDDNAELFLMNLLRGSGPAGLKGMARIRGNIIRPLLDTKRDAIMLYLSDNGLSYREDASNTDPAFLRNKIRHELLPLLEEAYNPAIRENLNRMADIFDAEERWLEELVDQTLARIASPSGPEESLLSVSGLKALPTAQFRRVLRRVIGTLKGDLRGIAYSHMDAAVRLVHSPRQTAWLDLPARIRLEKSGPYLRVRREPDNLRKCRPTSSRLVFQYGIHLEDLPVSRWIPEIGKTLRLSCLSDEQAAKIAANLTSRISRQDDNRQDDKMTAYLDLDLIHSPLTVRNPEAGDRITPLGMKGSQKIKDVFINHKVPRAQRAFFPVLCSRETILWLAGRALSEKAKITSSTRHILKAELIPGK